mgnify:CR=1 FL=1
MSRSRLWSVYIIEILEKHATPSKPVRQYEIRDYLEKEYGETVGVNTVARYIADLVADGRIETDGQRGQTKPCVEHLLIFLFHAAMQHTAYDAACDDCSGIDDCSYHFLKTY